MVTRAYPNTTLNTHDVRKPDSNPVAGGPYLQGYDPTVVGAKSAYTGDAGNGVNPNGQVDASRTAWLATPSAVQGGATFTPGAALLGQESSGDQPGTAYSEVNEDHAV